MEIIIILALVFLNGVFSLSEMAFVFSKKFKLERAKKYGSKGAKIALELSDNPTRFLSTIQIGITLIGILLGIYSGENLTSNFTNYLMTFSLIKPYAHSISVSLIVVIITYISILFGELFPKRLGMYSPEKTAITMAVPMKFLLVFASPLVWLLSISNDFLLRIIGVKNIEEEKVTEEEIKFIVRESAKEGEIRDIEYNIVEKVFELGDRKVDTLFTHRSEIVFFNSKDTWETVKSKITKNKHSVYPVCENGDLDNILGIIYLKDLFVSTNNDEFSWLELIREPIFVNEGIYAYKVLELFKQEKRQFGIVVDEYGITNGIITMDDVVNALVGDVKENFQDEYQIVKNHKNSWVVDGQYSVIEFVKYFDLRLEIKDISKYTTIAGLIIHKSRKLPEIGDTFRIDNLELKIIDKEDQRIDKILVTRKFEYK
jgi:putative hemolysin